MRYTPDQKNLFKAIAPLVETRYEMENVIAPVLATMMGRTHGAICKQIENEKGIHWRQIF